jgi:hypothetical protein
MWWERSPFWLYDTHPDCVVSKRSRKHIKDTLAVQEENAAKKAAGQPAGAKRKAINPAGKAKTRRKRNVKAAKAAAVEPPTTMVCALL